MSLPKLEIQYPDGTSETVQVRPSDVVRFEAHFKVPYVSVWVDAQMAVSRVPDISGHKPEDLDPETLNEVTDALARVDAAISTTHLYFLAWSAKTSGKEGTFEDWLDTIEGTSYMPGSGDDAAPLERGGSTPTPSPTPPSPSTPDEPSSPS